MTNKQLKQLIKGTGFSQAEFATLAGIPQSTLKTYLADPSKSWAKPIPPIKAEGIKSVAARLTRSAKEEMK